ncbi:MAG: hypothetical protein ACW99R_15135 [Candidatus Hodarchaeales archaeon]|jgi:hypothetical protein
MKKYNNTNNFYALISNLFKVDDLSALHKFEPNYAASDGVDGLGNDTHSFYHNLFYTALNNNWESFIDEYKRFIRANVLPKFPNEKSLIYQSLPSFRIQYPNAKAVTTIHCDSDKNHKHPLGELNILVPVTEMIDSSTIWVESLPNLGDFFPVNLRPDDWILWNGNRCRHFNKVNKSEKTRISLDFRILPRVCYDPDYSRQTATTKKKFVIGEYYSVMERENV